MPMRLFWHPRKPSLRERAVIAAERQVVALNNLTALVSEHVERSRREAQQERFAARRAARQHDAD